MVDAILQRVCHYAVAKSKQFTQVATIVHTMRTYACSCYMQQGCMVVTFWQMQSLGNHCMLALIVQQLYGMQLLPVLHLECFSCCIVRL